VEGGMRASERDRSGRGGGGLCGSCHLVVPFGGLVFQHHEILACHPLLQSAVHIIYDILPHKDWGGGGEGEKGGGGIDRKEPPRCERAQCLSVPHTVYQSIEVYQNILKSTY